jgi:nitroimidazol reductase NimA-like FMN-containing flavoprotein (pyridoxamine 5'-phosphate oxidase superfamily)
MTIIKLPTMSDKEIKEAIKSQNLCRIAFIDDEFPYISPFQYVYIDEILYFHFTDYGKKKKILSKNNNVCISIEHFEPDLSSYYFISMKGKLDLVEDEFLRKEVINQMVKSAKSKYSYNFLSAHGFEKSQGWDAFTTKNQTIYKFIQTGNPIGLKSI